MDLTVPVIRKALVAALGTILLAMMTYTVFAGIFEIIQQISMVIMLLLPCAFLQKPVFELASGAGSRLALAIDVVIAFAVIVAAGHIFFGFEAYFQRTQFFLANGYDILAGLIIGAAFLEAARRHIGIPMVVLCLIALAYAAFGQLLTGTVQGTPFDVSSFTQLVLLGSNGVFGPALQVTSTTIYAFMLYGAALEALGAGTIFMQIANALTRRSYGGPAKAAVVGSSLFGTISGSSMANVVMTGSITIPMMKRTGFKPHVAASIEAAASSGGQIVPPIMGATVFVIAAYTGTTYGQIAWHALIPAFLFYTAIFANVHLTALKENIRPLDTAERWTRQDGYKVAVVLLPTILLVYLLVTHFPTMLTGFYATAALLIITLPFRTLRITPSRFLHGVLSLTRAIVIVVVACGAAGIIMGVVLQSGLGAELSTLMLDIAGGNIYLLAVLTALVSIVLGMGLPTIVVYIILATLIAPALVNAGLSVIGAHLFVFYYGLAALLTPPLAVVSYTAAGIAGSDPNYTGFYAAWFALAKYVVPFMFLFNPELVGEGPWMLVAAKFVCGIAALFCVSLGTIGFWHNRLSKWQRVLYFVTAILLGVVPLSVNMVGVVLFAILCTIHFRSSLSFSREQAKDPP
ncbi:TRAP transporter fused permease subunit [Hoeflea sp. CAU 1731]